MLGPERRHSLGCLVNIGGEFEPHARRAQRLAISVDEDALVWRTRLAFQ
jgi:hypothetical protein